MEIEGYENYTIDETGNIWSKHYNRFLKPTINKQGYLKVSLSKNCKRKYLSIHRLLALQFIPNPNNYPEVDHIDTNTSNNNLSNLRWATREMQIENRNAFGEIKHKYICYCYAHKGKSKYYRIKKRGYFCKKLNVKKYTLDHAIELRTKLLLENGCVPLAITK